MVELTEIEQKEIELERQMEDLKKEKKNLLVKQGKAYLCKNCKRFVEKCTVSTETEKRELCHICLRELTLQERNKILFNKLEGAKVIAIKSYGLGSLKEITLYLNGVMFELRAEGDCDDQWINVDETKKQYNEEVKRPGDKPRVEKPLLLKVKR